MILLALDFETTGLDKVADRPIEVGAVLYSTGQHKCIESEGFLVKSEVPVTAEITKITGIHQALVDKFGYDSADSCSRVVDMMATADAIIGHNVLRFDKIIVENWCRRAGFRMLDKLWIDTMIDIKGHEGKKLTYLAADHGILNLFPHSALADCQTVLTVIKQYDINEIVKRAQTPTVIIQAHHNRSQNDLAKAAKFRWNPQHKIWWKPVKETDIDELEKSVAFDIGFAAKELLDDLMSS